MIYITAILWFIFLFYLMKSIRNKNKRIDYVLENIEDIKHKLRELNTQKSSPKIGIIKEPFPLTFPRSSPPNNSYSETLDTSRNIFFKSKRKNILQNFANSIFLTIKPFYQNTINQIKQTKDNHNLSKTGFVKLAVNKVMRLRKPEFIEVIVSCDLNQINNSIEYFLEEYKPEEKETAEIKTSKFMKVTLEARDFDIQSSSPEIQVIEQDSVGEWKWKVTPTAIGTKKLLIKVWSVIVLPYNHEKFALLKTFRKEIKVKVTLLHLFDKYKSEITAIIIALISTASVYNWEKIKSLFNF